MPYEGESDHELVGRVAAGDGTAFDTLHRRYHARIYRLAYLQTNNHADAEDIAAETFCRAFERIGQFGFKGCESIYPWLHRIAVNLSIDLCRDRSSRVTVSLDTDTIEGIRGFLDRLADAHPTPEELLERHEIQTLVRASIASLSEDQRDTIVFRFLGELSLKEIADAMHRSEGAVKALLHRGIVSLRKEILERLSKIERMDLLAHTGDATNVRGDSVRVHRRADQTG